MLSQFELLGTLVRDIYQMFTGLYYMALPVCILLAVVIGFLKSEPPNHIELLKRVFVATLLLIAFPEISNAIIGICDGVAKKIDDMSGLDTLIRMAQEKSSSYTFAKNVLLLKFDDLIIAVLSFLSFALLYIARYLTIAMYYFFWVLLSALSPLLILCYVFPKTAHITENLFKGLIEVASWKIIWALLSAMLTSLSFGNMYKAEGSYLTLIVLNFIIALAMLMTPMVVKALVGEGAQAMAGTLSVATVASVVALPARAAMVAGHTKSIGSKIAQPLANRYQAYQTQKEDRRKSLRY